MTAQLEDSIKRLLIRLEDVRREVQGITGKVEYPMTAKCERAYDALETAERYLGELISK